jgi:Flp pilus assembly protein CpaB
MNSNLAIMIVLIVLIVSIAGVLKAAISRRHHKHGGEHLPPPENGEAARLRDEVRVLKERVQVLERIATDRNHLLEQEIEQLRDR